MARVKWKPGDIVKLAFDPGGIGRWLVMIPSPHATGPACLGVYLSGKSDVLAHIGHGSSSMEGKSVLVPHDEVPDKVWAQLVILRLEGRF